MKSILCAAFVLLASVADAIELGAGVAAYQESQRLTPFVSVGFNPYHTTDDYTTTYVHWSRDNQTHHTSLVYTFPFYETRHDVKLYADLGAGMQWDDFDTWRPELGWGLSACGPVLGFTTRAAWTHLETGGDREADDVFSLGVYFGRDRATPAGN